MIETDSDRQTDKIFQYSIMPYLRSIELRTPIWISQGEMKL